MRKKLWPSTCSLHYRHKYSTWVAQKAPGGQTDRLHNLSTGLAVDFHMVDLQVFLSSVSPSSQHFYSTRERMVGLNSCGLGMDKCPRS